MIATPTQDYWTTCDVLSRERDSSTGPNCSIGHPSGRAACVDIARTVSSVRESSRTENRQKYGGADHAYRGESLHQPGCNVRSHDGGYHSGNRATAAAQHHHGHG